MRILAAALFAIPLCACPAHGQSAPQPPAATDTEREASISLLKAIRGRNAPAVAAVLVAHPGLVQAEFQDKATPLIVAALTRNGPAFVRPEDNPDFAMIAGLIRMPTIFEAALLGDVAAIRRLAEASPTGVNPRGPAGWTPLHFAAYAGKDEVLVELIRRGAQIDRIAGPAFGTTPVQAALLGRRNRAAELLLQAGASPFARTSDGGSYLHEAAVLDDAAMAEILARNGVPLTARRDDGTTAAEVAEARGHAAAAAALRQLEATARAKTPP